MTATTKRLPEFTAEASLFQANQTYRAAGRLRQSLSSIQPASLSTCVRWCGGDPDCLSCCLCISRGGKPSHCCF
jgi:hypothetical protein